MVRTWHFNAMARVQSLVGELRSHKSRGEAKKYILFLIFNITLNIILQTTF